MGPGRPRSLGSRALKPSPEARAPEAAGARLGPRRSAMVRGAPRPAAELRAPSASALLPVQGHSAAKLSSEILLVCKRGTGKRGLKGGDGPGSSRPRRSPPPARSRGAGAPRPHGDAARPGSGVAGAEAGAVATTRPGPPQPPGTAPPPRARAGPPLVPGPRSRARRTDLRVPGRRVRPDLHPPPSAPRTAHVRLARRGWNQIQPAGR